MAAPLVGRDRELAELWAALHDARSGRGSFFMLVGEPGIGKTRLAEALARRAEQERVVVLWARSWEGGGAAAFWPWQQIVRAWTARRDDKELARDLGVGAPWLAQLAPELCERLPGLEPPGSLESDQARFALFDALTTFLRTLSAGVPLLLVL